MPWPWVFRKVPNNTGISATVGAAILSVGLALLGVVRWLGIVLCAIGAVWIVWTFALKLLADHKTERFHQEIARALERGRELRADVTRDRLSEFTREASDLTDAVGSLILAALGEPARGKFLESPRNVGQWVTGAPAVRQFDDRMKRLVEILDRGERVDLSFDQHRRWIG